MRSTASVCNWLAWGGNSKINISRKFLRTLLNFSLLYAYPYEAFTGIGVGQNLAATGFLNHLGNEQGPYSTRGGKLFTSVKRIITINFYENELLMRGFLCKWYIRINYKLSKHYFLTNI